MKPQHLGLHEALLPVAGLRDGTVDAVKLGKWLSRHKGRVALEVRLEGRTDPHKHTVKWWLE